MPPTITGGTDDSDSDIPLAAAKLSKEKAQIIRDQNQTSKRLQAEDKKAAAAKKRKATVKKEEESDSDVPLKGKKRVSPAKKANGVKKEESSDGDKPLAKKARATKPASAKKETAVKTEAKGKRRVKKSETPAVATPGENGENEEGEDEEEEEYKWWEQPETDGTVKWTTLEHNGVVFPPPYEPLPKDVKMLYSGVPVTLPVAAEEIAGFFGAMLETNEASNSKFVQNFFHDFQEVLKESGGARDPQGKVSTA